MGDQGGYQEIRTTDDAADVSVASSRADQPDEASAPQSAGPRSSRTSVVMDPADLLRPVDAKVPDQTVRIFDDTDTEGKLGFSHGLMLIDLENGIPEFYGEQQHTKWKDTVGSFACRQMVAEQRNKCGVVIHHLDVPYLEAKSQLVVALQMADVMSDVFFAAELFRAKAYENIEMWVKVLFIALLAISQALWVLSALSNAYKRWRKDLESINSKKDIIGANLTMGTKGQWFLGCFFENLFPAPTTILSSRRVVKRVMLGGHAVWVLGYTSPASFRFRFNKGVRALWPTLFFEDMPLLFIQVYVYRKMSPIGFVIVICTAFSLICIIHKACVLWEQRRCREEYRQELLHKIAETGAEPLEINWRNVYRDEFGEDPQVAEAE